MGYRIADTFTPAARHAARAFKDGSQTILVGAFVTATPFTESEDTDGYFDPGALDRFTIPAGQAGLYLVTGNIRISQSAPALDSGGFLLENGLTYGDALADKGDARSFPMLRTLATGAFIQMQGIGSQLGPPAPAIVGGASNDLPTAIQIVRIDTGA